MLPKAESVGLDIGAFIGIEDTFEKDDPSCLDVKSVLSLMNAEEIFGDSVREYKSPEKLKFLLEKYPGYKIKTSTIAEEAQGIYILATLTEEQYEVEDMAGPAEMLSIKFCSVRATDMTACSCTGFIGVANKLMGIMAEGGQLSKELQEIKSITDLVGGMDVAKEV
jgi:hypothetical protein